MKRVTLNIDLEDNQIFDEQVVETIKAKVKELVRNENYNYVANEAPMAEAKPVIHAHWYLKNNAAFHQCSNCEKFAPDCDDGFSVEEMLSEYCPHCGALMDEEKIDE